MAYVILDEVNQKIIDPPTDKGNVLNYNKIEELLIKDGYIDVEDSLIAVFNAGKGKIVGNTIQDISKSKELRDSLAAKEMATLIEQNYTSKATVAYSGIYYDYTNAGNTQEVIFQTNSTSVPLIDSTFTSFTKEGSTRESVNWKFWTVGLAVDYPIFIVLTKDQFMQFHSAVDKLVDEAVAIEASFDEKIHALSTDELLDDATVEAFISSMNDNYKAIKTKITLT